MTNHTKRAYIPFLDDYFTPTTLTEILEFREFYKVLGQSFVFIQNKKTISDRLLQEKIQIVNSAFDVHRLHTHLHSLETIVEYASDKAKWRLEPPPLLLVETTDAAVNTNELCQSVAKKRQCGVWIRGYVRDLDPKTLTLFDVLILFDMSDHEYEILRTTIHLLDDYIAGLRQVSNYSTQGRMLFFLNDGYRDNLPFVLRENPVLLSM